MSRLSWRVIVTSLIVNFVPHMGHGAVINFASDTTWETYDAFPPSANFLGFAAPPPCCGVPEILIPGGTTIWGPGVTLSTPSSLMEFYFAKSFNLPGTPSGGMITITADDLAEVIVNGSSIGTQGTIVPPGGGQIEIFDLGPFLEAGANEIVIRAQNGPYPGFGSGPLFGGNPASLLFTGILTSCEATCCGAVLGCKSAGKSLLLLKDNVSDDAKDKLTFKWLKGVETSLAQLGTPTGTTSYTLCLYSGTASAAVALPAGTDWQPLGSKGFKYNDVSGTPNDARKAVVKSGAAGKAKALVKGKGVNLPDELVPPLPLPVTAQLVNDDNTCFEAVFDSGDVIKNDAKQFKAKK